MTKISGTPLSYVNEYEIKWNYSGYPPGRYNITVWAVDNNGYNYYTHFGQYTYGNYPETYDTYFTIGVEFFVNLKAIDSMSHALQGATVVATVSGSYVDSGITDSNGLANMSLFGGSYQFQVIWQGVIVATQDEIIINNVPEANPIMLNCQVYYPKFGVVDSHNEPLSNAAVYIVHPNGSSAITPLKTNETGHVSLFQVPLGVYNLTVRWRGMEVTTLAIFVDSNAEYTIQCPIYYITFETIDSREVSLEYVQIVVYNNITGIVLEFKITDSSGNAVSRLPTGQFDINVYWHDVLVHTTNRFDVSEDGTLILNCDVYYLTIRTLDSKSDSLSTAHVTVKDETGYIISSNYTDNSGESVFRLASGNYVVEARYKTTYHLSNVDEFKTVTVSLNQSKTETIRFENYPIPIYATNAFIVALVVGIVITLLSLLPYLIIRKYKRQGAVTAPVERDIPPPPSSAEEQSLLEEDIKEPRTK